MRWIIAGAMCALLAAQELDHHPLYGSTSAEGRVVGMWGTAQDPLLSALDNTQDPRPELTVSRDQEWFLVWFGGAAPVAACTVFTLVAIDEHRDRYPIEDFPDGYHPARCWWLDQLDVYSYVDTWERTLPRLDAVWEVTVRALFIGTDGESRTIVSNSVRVRR